MSTEYTRGRYRFMLLIFCDYVDHCLLCKVLEDSGLEFRTVVLGERFCLTIWR